MNGRQILHAPGAISVNGSVSPGEPRTQALRSGTQCSINRATAHPDFLVPPLNCSELARKEIDFLRSLLSATELIKLFFGIILTVEKPFLPESNSLPLPRIHITHFLINAQHCTLSEHDLLRRIQNRQHASIKCVGVAGIT